MAMNWVRKSAVPYSLSLRLSPSHPLIGRPFSASSKIDQVRESENTHKSSWFSQLVSKDASVAQPNWGNKDSLSRWSMIAPAFLTHMCIGSPFAWSAVSSTLATEIGFVVPAAADWTFSQVALPLSLVFVMQGFAAAGGGKWQMRVGERTSLLVASSFFGGGLLVAAAGISMHSLPLLYTGYGVLAGIGVGLAYTPPVSMLVQWFPERKGLASGMTIAGFGSGALVFAPLMNKLCSYFAQMPTYLGPAGSCETITRDGKLFVQDSLGLTEVVLANAADLAKLPYELSEGLYVVGSGSTGAASALAVCGLGYWAIMASSALMIKKPHPSTPLPPMPVSLSGKAHTDNVHVDNVMKTPQFGLLSFTFFCLASGGIGMFSVAKPMMSEVFGGVVPSIVTASFASAYVMMLSGANLSGRLVWSSFSDRVGRRNTFHLFTIGSIPLYLCLPYLVDQVVSTHSPLALYTFVGSTVLAVSYMGGLYAILPAYESDLFGSKYLAANHGRMLLASSAAALLGPSMLLTLRQISERQAVQNLLATIDPIRFFEKFGAPIEQAEYLLATKTLTISKLMEIVPEGVMDPSPFLYNTTMYSMAALMATASISHALVKPVHPKYFEKIKSE